MTNCKNLKNTTLTHTYSGMTLVEVMMAMGLVSVVSMGTIAIMQQTAKVQSSATSNNEINAFIGNLTNVLMNDATCTAALTGQTVALAANTNSNLSIRLGSATTVQAGSFLGKSKIQSIAFVPSDSSTAPFFNTNGTPSTDRFIQGTLNLSFLRFSSTNQASVGVGSNQVNFNNIRLSIRTNSSGSIISCTGLRHTIGTGWFNIPSCLGQNKELYADGTGFQCRDKIVCSADQYSIGTNANGVPQCVDYPRCGCAGGNALVMPDSTTGDYSSTGQASSSSMQKTLNGRAQTICVPGQGIWYDPQWRTKNLSGPLQCRVTSCPPGTIVKAMDASGNITQCGDMKINECVDDPNSNWRISDCTNPDTGYRATKGRKCPPGSWCVGDCNTPQYADCRLNAENPVINNGAHTTAQCVAVGGSIQKYAFDNTETMFCQKNYSFYTSGWPIKGAYYNKTTCNFCTDSSVCGCDTSPNVAARGDGGQSCSISPLQSPESGYSTSAPKFTYNTRVSCNSWTVPSGSFCSNGARGSCGQRTYKTCYSYDGNSSSSPNYECYSVTDLNRVLYY